MPLLEVSTLNSPFLQSARTNLLLLLVLDPGDFLLSLSPLSSSLEGEEILFFSLLPPFFLLPVRSSSCPVSGARTPTLSPLPPAAVPPRKRTRSTPSFQSHRTCTQVSHLCATPANWSLSQETVRV